MIFKNIYIKINSGIIKIPTLLGLGLLLFGLAGGVYLTTQNQILKTKATASTVSKNVNIYNLSAGSAAISWQTDETTTDFVQAWILPEQKTTYRDDRDLNTPQTHKLHFVTLTNLTPNTVYYYQIHSGQTIYPDTPSTFTTLSPTETLNWNPIVGTILNIDNRPVDEALVTLELANAQKLATITKVGGNFIMPLSSLRDANLSKIFSGNNTPYKAKLIISGPQSSSQVSILVSLENPSLPPVILGKDTDLTQNTSNPKPTLAPISAEIQKYDLNGDGIINATDLSIILKNFGSLKNIASISAEKQKIDLNKDSVIDQKDVNLILPYIK